MQHRLISALEKVFPDGRGASFSRSCLTALRGESAFFQWAVQNDTDCLYACPTLEAPFQATLRLVKSVPVRCARTPENSDENYLSWSPGLYPDVLVPLTGDATLLPFGQWQAFYGEIVVPEGARPGDYTATLTLRDVEGAVLAQDALTLTVLDAVLPPQRLMHTEWFHADCLADYYGVPAFSEEHWRIVEAFVRAAVRRGCNMLLTPHLTPALDTRVGGERTTVQLVDVYAQEGGYRFGFEKLDQWVAMAERCGMKYLEMSHLFTQWGAEAAPKVMVWENGAPVRRFGWDTPAVGGAYTDFLRAYLPALTARLKALGVADRTYFHISDEPHAAQVESYRAAKQSVADCLAGFPIMDALSDYELTKVCGIACPIVAEDALEPFLANGVSPLWGYYCCCPSREMPNRFLQMPLSRMRAMGALWWRYGLQGFLHWGYNFYNAVHSVAHINPFLDTEAGGGFPAGDSFLVYPGTGGEPWESLRLTTLHQALQDLRALTLLEEKIGRKAALALLEQDGALTMRDYPRDSRAMERLRERVNQALANG